MLVSSNSKLMTVTLGRDVLFQYRRFSLYNSPYVAHNRGCAIDLYPGSETDSSADEAVPSPVAGEVLDVRSVRAPPKPYAAEHDYLVLVDTGSHVARLLHIEPTVEAGDVIDVGDPVGDLVRAGFFAPWVPNHIHLEFRPPEANPYRASGSLPLSVDVRMEPVPWDGTGTVAEVGETYVVLDAPAHPDPGSWIGIADDSGSFALDGGLPHYDGGGAHGNGATETRSVSLLGEHIGTATGRDLAWDGIEVLANGVPITGLSLFLTRIEMGAKLVRPGHGFEIGDEVKVTIGPGSSPA